jgi:hypothetical protein
MKKEQVIEKENMREERITREKQEYIRKEKK